MTKLISSPDDYPRSYICDECIAVCNSILDDEKVRPGPPETHPLAGALLSRVEAWARREAAGQDAGLQLERVYQTAKLMFALEDETDRLRDGRTQPPRAEDV